MAKTVKKSTKPPTKPAAKAAAKPSSARREIVPSKGSNRPKVQVRSRRNVAKGLQPRSQGLPPGDLTLKLSEAVPSINLHRPSFDKGSLIFRPLWNWNVEEYNDTQILVPDEYRFSIEPNKLSDIIRQYPAAYFLGDGDETYTFLLYDKDLDESEYDRRQNPYVLLYNGVYRAAKRDYTHPEWAQLIDGKRKTISPPCDLYFIQGVIFKRGDTLYVGRDRSPKGLGKKDPPQIVQLKNTAGEGVLKLFNAVNEDWEGDSNDWENSMLIGNPVSPEYGRFISVYNPEKEQLGGEELDELSEITVGSSGEAEAGGGQEIRGYSVRADDRFVLNGKKTKIKPSFAGPALEMLQDRVVWWDDVINLISDEEQAVVIAKALKHYRKVLEYVWAEHPEFLTKDVMKILNNSKQISLKGGQDLNELAAGAGLDIDDATPGEYDVEAEEEGDEEYEEVASEEVATDEEAEYEEEAEEEAAEEEEAGEEEEEAGDEDEYEYVEEEVEEEAGEEEEEEEAGDDEDEYEYVEEEVEEEAGEEEEAGDDEDEYEYVEEEVEEEEVDASEYDEEEEEGEEEEPDEDAEAEQAIADAAKLAKDRAAARKKSSAVPPKKTAPAAAGKKPAPSAAPKKKVVAKPAGKPVAKPAGKPTSAKPAVKKKGTKKKSS